LCFPQEEEDFSLTSGASVEANRRPAMGKKFKRNFITGGSKIQRIYSDFSLFSHPLETDENATRFGHRLAGARRISARA
jgi:hypothetical protein